MIPENKLKKYRNLSSLTQEELAKSSGISIRTIQRIEKGLTTGSSHTIKTLAKSLNIETTDLMTYNDSSHLFEETDMSKVKLLNLSALLLLFFPVANIMLLSIIYYWNRNNGQIKTLGRKILSFQILSIFMLPFLIVIFFLFLNKGNGQIPLPFAASYLIYVLVNIIITIRTAIKINKEKEILKFVPNLL